MLNIISMSVLYLNRVSAKFGVTWKEEKTENNSTFQNNPLTVFIAAGLE